MPQTREIKNLDQLMDGGVNERFNNELARVWDNVFDPNTDPLKARKLTMTIEIKPNARRDAAGFKVDVKSTLAPPVPLAQTVFLSIGDNGSVTATEITNQVPGQVNLDGDVTIPNVIEFKNAKA